MHKKPQKFYQKTFSLANIPSKVGGFKTNKQKKIAFLDTQNQT
jgi:hypothetical protein